MISTFLSPTIFLAREMKVWNREELVPGGRIMGSPRSRLVFAVAEVRLGSFGVPLEGWREVVVLVPFWLLVVSPLVAMSWYGSLNLWERRKTRMKLKEGGQLLDIPRLLDRRYYTSSHNAGSLNLLRNKL